VRGVNRPIPSTYTVHPGDATQNLQGVRALTTLERARIQTFPENFKLEGSKTDLEQIIGNAVPVELAYYIGKHVLEYVNNPIYKKEQTPVYYLKNDLDMEDLAGIRQLLFT